MNTVETKLPCITMNLPSIDVFDFRNNSWILNKFEKF